MTAGSVAGASTEIASASGTVDPLEFDSSASLLDANGNYLTDDSVIAVYAESTAVNQDADENDDAVYYDTATPIPLVAVDGPVVGFGATLVSNEANFKSGNEEFVLNVWDAKLGGNGTVLYDEGHDQFHSLSDFSNMANYAENNGYTVKATSTLTDDLSGADAVWITAPSTAFTDSEKAALTDFVSNGGAIFLHDRADYNDYDETANFDDITAALEVAFRFNDDQVTDNENNGGRFYKPTTAQFNDSFDFFADRPGMDIYADQTYEAEVLQTTDGDTVDIRFDSGREENVRILGIDTPEKEAYQQYERIQEWYGIDDLNYLAEWGDNATDYAKARLAGETIELSFDSEEDGIFDTFDRLLAYIHYDETGNGSYDAFYNYRAVADGYARRYASAFSNHETFYEAETAAQANGDGLWNGSDPAATGVFRDRDVEDVFFPNAVSVRTTDGGVSDDRVPVYAESTATQALDGGYDYDSDLPLVAVDGEANVGLVGGLTIDESYEVEEGFNVDTSEYENFTLLSNLLDHLSALDGKVLIEGGHGQFQAGHALSEEDAAYYLRHLEGFEIEFDQVNEGYADRLTDARALIVTPPAEAFTTAEADAIASFAADGGAVVLLGGSDATDTARGNLNDLAAAVGTDLRLNEDAVTDDSSNVDDNSSIPTTTVFDESFPLFTAFGSGSDGDGSGDGSLAVAEVNEAADNENVVFENTGDGSLDLTGWTVEDEAGYAYEFPDGFTVDAGSRVTLYTGEGTDTATELYWGYGIQVWNDDGDTVYVYDDSDAVVIEHTYPQGEIAVAEVNEAADNESVVLENIGGNDLDLTGWTVEDEAGYAYEFPDGFTLTSGGQVTLYTGDGTDTDAELYWEMGISVWNDDGDTVHVLNDEGSLVEEYTYPNGELVVAEVNEAAADENVVFKNVADVDTDLTGWSVEDEAGYSYEFPDGFTLAPGTEVTLYTGDGTDTDTELYWGMGTAVWNDDGDTVYAYDDTGTLKIEYTYPQGELAVAEMNEAASDENVVFENVGNSALDLTGWTVEDEAGYTYEFPDGFTVDTDSQVTLYTGEGTDTATELYWGYGIQVWNDDGDTVYVYDEADQLMVEFSY